MPKTAAITAMLGKEPEVSRLADEVAKRGRQGQQNPAGARTSGLRGDELRQRSAHRGGGALLVVARSEGCSKRTVFRGNVGDRT